MHTQKLFVFRCSAKELTLSITPECVGEMATLWQTDGFCGLLSDTTGVFASCIAALGPAYMENCEYDVCSQDNVDNAKDAACRSLAAFNLECSNIGLGADWRAVSGCGTHNGLRLSVLFFAGFYHHRGRLNVFGVLRISHLAPRFPYLNYTNNSNISSSLHLSWYRCTSHFVSR